MEELDLGDEYLGTVLDRFFGAGSDVEDEELARRFPRVYRAVTGRTVAEVERLLARAQPGAGRKYRIPRGAERLVGARAAHATEEELAKDLREGRYRAAIVFGYGRVERWTWKSGRVEPGDPADAYEPARTTRGQLEREVVFPLGGQGEVGRPGDPGEERFAVAVGPGGSSPAFRFLWVHRGRMDRLAAEALEAGRLRAGPRRRAASKRRR
jgi:hypothetical protein